MSGQEVEVQEMLSWVWLSGTHSKIFNKYLFMENIDGSPKRIILLCTDHYVFFNSDFCALVFVPAVTTPLFRTPSCVHKHLSLIAVIDILV